MKIGIVGSGFVGSTAAYAMVMQGIGREIVLVDKNQARSNAEADDIFHAVPFAHPLTIRTGDYADLKDCRAVIITAGVNQRPGESRRELLQRNAAVFREIIPQVIAAAPRAILVVATNPVDVMTHIATNFAIECGLPVSRVIGSGTTLDTARFRTLLGNHFGVDSRHVHAYVIGEHGDSEVLVWSGITMAGLNPEEFGKLHQKSLDPESIADIDRRVRRAAYHIIEGKGATYYGIGSALARIIDVILHDQRSIMTICSRMAGIEGFPDVTIAMPHLFGGDGIISSIPLQLTAKETSALRVSAEVIQQTIATLDLPQVA
jgi:L-lactate dehydrogenase